VRVAALPGGERALAIALALYRSARPEVNVLVTGLSNVNLVLHPPGSILGAAWIEATKGQFTFYVDGLTEGVGRVMENLDLERRTVGRSFGIELVSLVDEMRAIGTIEDDVNPHQGLAGIRGGVANRAILAPSGFAHRYYQEDFWYGLVPFLAMAEIAQVDTPCAKSLMQLADVAVGPSKPSERRTAQAMGIAGFDKHRLLAFVNDPRSHEQSRAH
jgi:opine dehydrogenase